MCYCPCRAHYPYLPREDEVDLIAKFSDLIYEIAARARVWRQVLRDFVLYHSFALSQTRYRFKDVTMDVVSDFPLERCGEVFYRRTATDTALLVPDRMKVQKYGVL